MFEIIPAESRGAANHGWLDTRFSFSFADYHDPERMGFGSLRVINEDHIEAGKGFGTHPHRDMEIVTYIIDGELEHKDSMGNGSRIRRGELQRMTAGTGVFHSEFNPTDQQTHLLQIWILPEQNSLEPGYEQKLFPREDKLNQWRLVGSRNGDDGSLTIHQDIRVSAAIIEPGERIEYPMDASRRAYLQVVDGELEISGRAISAGDGVEISDTGAFDLHAMSESEVLLFDMA